MEKSSFEINGVDYTTYQDMASFIWWEVMEMPDSMMHLLEKNQGEFETHYMKFNEIRLEILDFVGRENGQT